ncbi:mitotic-spindle organizing protein 1 [Anolis carolinensis]|uniref:mitotic-spindle organizing protein 1 n=1 Tax=Anolis carolinensis TaxID=28377 RepID=UPI002F2B4765
MERNSAPLFHIQPLRPLPPVLESGLAQELTAKACAYFFSARLRSASGLEGTASCEAAGALFSVGPLPRFSCSSAMASPAASLNAVRETMDVLLEISRILNTGLDMETLSICVRLCEQGINPEALSAVIKELRKATETLKANENMAS